MDKLKNLLGGGSKSEDQEVYGTPDAAGKVAGEGAHFGQSKHPAGASEGVHVGGGSDAASITAVKDGVAGPFSETAGPHTDAIRAAQAATGTTPIHAEMTGQQHGSPYASHGVDPRVDGGSARNTAVGGGLASAAADTAYTSDKSNRADHENVTTVPSSTTAPASSFSQPSTSTPSAQTSNIGTAITTGSAPIGSSSTFSNTAPINTVPDLSSTYGSTATSVPAFSSNNPSTTAATSTNPSTSAVSHTTPSSALPIVSGKTATEPEHHVGRDAALGAGVGAAGVGAYEASRSSTSATTGTSSSGPLGSLRDLIDQKTGSSAAEQSSGSREVDPNTTSGRTALGTSATGSGASHDVPSSLPLGTLRPLIDEKTGSHAADQSTGSHASSDLSSGLPLGTLRPLIDEKTGSHAADQSAGSREVGSSSTNSGLGSAAAGAGLGSAVGAGLGASSSSSGVAPSTTGVHPTTATGPSITPSSNTGLGSSSTGLGSSNTGLGSSSNTGLGSSSNTGLGSSSNTGLGSSSSTGLGHSTTTTGTTSGTSSTGPLGSLRSLIDEKTGSSAATDSAGSREVGSSSDHHYGRDAALGAGAGAAGLGAYEASKHHDTSSSRPDTSLASSTTGSHPATATGPSALSSSTQPTSTIGGSSATSGLTPSSSSAQPSSSFQSTAPIQPIGNETNRSVDPSTSTSSHHGRDAALGAGAAAAGLGAYEAGQHHNSSTTAGQPSTTTGPSSVAGGLLGQFDYLGGIHGNTTAQPSSLLGATSTSATAGTPVASSGPAHHSLGGSGTTTTTTQPTTTSDSHLGRDAALGAGAGVLGAGAYEHHKHHAGDSDIKSTATTGGAAPGHSYGDNRKDGVLGGGLDTTSDPNAYSRHKEELREAEHDKSEKAGLGTKIKSLFNRNKDDKDDDVKDKHHHGKEAAVGAGAVGAGALGAHEYEKHHAGSSTIDPARSNPASDFPQAVSEQKVYRDSLGHLQTDPSTTSHVPTTVAGESGVVRDTLGNYKDVSGSGPSATTSSGDHRGLQAAGAGAGLAGAGALGAHEYNKHHDNTTTPAVVGASGTTATQGDSSHHGHHHGHHGHGEADDRHSYAYHPDHTHHHRDEAAVGAGAGAVGATALARDHHTTHATGTTPIGSGVSATDPSTTGGLGSTHGYAHEGYLHQKTEADIAAERRNSIPVVGVLHREGRFHGKEGGAPGAVGVPPQERDEGYIESQKQLPILHGKHKGETAGLDETHHERNRLHKDPPAGHPAAQAAAGLGAAGLGAEHATGTSTGPSLLHGSHASTLPDNKDLNVEHPKHDPANMGYTGTGANTLETKALRDDGDRYTGQTYDGGL